MRFPSTEGNWLLEGANDKLKTTWQSFRVSTSWRWPGIAKSHVFYCVFILIYIYICFNLFYNTILGVFCKETLTPWLAAICGIVCFPPSQIQSQDLSGSGSSHKRTTMSTTLVRQPFQGDFRIPATSTPCWPLVWQTRSGNGSSRRWLLFWWSEHVRRPN